MSRAKRVRKARMVKRKERARRAAWKRKIRALVEQVLECDDAATALAGGLMQPILALFLAANWFKHRARQAELALDPVRDVGGDGERGHRDG